MFRRGGAEEDVFYPGLPGDSAGLPVLLARVNGDAGCNSRAGGTVAGRRWAAASRAWSGGTAPGRGLRVALKAGSRAGGRAGRPAGAAGCLPTL